MNGWNEAKLALGLPLFLKGHANAWFKSLEGADDMTFVELTSALIDHFASGAHQRRIRQALGQRRQTEWTRSPLLTIRTAFALIALD